MLLYNFLNILFTVLTMAIFARAIISWFPIRPDNPLITILNQLTDPILIPLRRVVPSVGMIDITPLVAIILLQVMQGFLARMF